MGIGRDLMEIGTMLIAVALISMFVKNASGTVQVIEAGTKGFGDLLNAATLQGGYGSF